MSEHELWLENPPKGTEVCLGFDGSENDDWTCIKAETRELHLHSALWRGSSSDDLESEDVGRAHPARRVNAAMDELNDRYKIIRAYCDPGFRDEVSWESQIEAWDTRYGPKKFIPWAMSGSSRITAVWEALKRFESDLQHHAITHDGCPITITHMRNARRFAKSGERYGLGKPKQTRKIDAAVTSVLAHEAACDARAAGWGRKRKAYLLTGSTTRGF